MIVIADTTPLRYLIAIGEEGLLPELFETVWIPSAVLNELSAASTPRLVRDFLAAQPAWLRIQDPSPDAIRCITATLDSGERAALALAKEFRADLLLLDDAAARREAALLGFDVTGTLGVVGLAAERKLIEVRTVLAKLRRSGFYATDALLRTIFGEWL